MEEIWKPIITHEGYLVSNLGRVKSIKFNKEIILKSALRGEYIAISLFKNGKKKTFSIHQLVAIAFLNHIPNKHKVVIDHIDDNKLNNRATNLQLLSSRENSIKSNRKKKHTSIYTGVHWNKHDKIWITMMSINGKDRLLGRFKNEIDAANLYQEFLKNNKKKGLSK